MMTTSNVHIPSLRPVVNSGQVSPEAETWLENAVNPFPDYETHPVGVPSETTAHTAVKHVQKQITVTAPVGTTGTWSCLALLMPFDTSPVNKAAYTATLSQDRSEISGVTQHPGSDFGILTVFTHDDSVVGDVNPFATDYKPANTFVQSITVSDAWFAQGAHRLSSCGFEITDNTPTLYAGGNLVCFRKDSMADHKTFLVSEPNPPRDLFPVDNTTLYAGFPNSVDAAYRVPGATSWNFKEGCYVTGTFNHHLEDFETLDPYGAIVLSAGAGPACLYVGGIPAGDSGGKRRLGIPWSKTHLNHSGAYGTGLQKEVNFTVTLKCDMEIIPNSDSVLVDFIRPGTPASPGMRNLYSKMSAGLPPAVLRADNDAGDFFKKMINMAAPLVSTIFPTAKPFVAPLQGLATRGVDALSARRKAKKAARPKRQATTKAQAGQVVAMNLTPAEAKAVKARRALK